MIACNPRLEYLLLKVHRLNLQFDELAIHGLSEFDEYE